MSLNKAIQYGKEKRRKYGEPKSIDSRCENHGSCAGCRHNRLHSNMLRAIIADEKIRDYMKER